MPDGAVAGDGIFSPGVFNHQQCSKEKAAKDHAVNSAYSGWAIRRRQFRDHALATYPVALPHCFSFGQASILFMQPLIGNDPRSFF